MLNFSLFIFIKFTQKFSQTIVIDIILNQSCGDLYC